MEGKNCGEFEKYKCKLESRSKKIVDLIVKNSWFDWLINYIPKSIKKLQAILKILSNLSIVDTRSSLKKCPP